MKKCNFLQKSVNFKVQLNHLIPGTEEDKDYSKKQKSYPNVNTKSNQCKDLSNNLNNEDWDHPSLAFASRRS